MKAKWFVPVPKTAEELKKLYKRLAVEHHPDKGGSTKDMQEINNEFAVLYEKLKNKHVNKDGEFYESRTGTTETAAEFIDIIEKLIHMDGIVIELCGSWLWISGNTKPYKDDLKKLSFRWSGNKSAWYFHRDGYKKKSSRYLTMDEIRGFYGSEVVHAEEDKKKRISA